MAISSTSTTPPAEHAATTFIAFFWLLVRRDLKTRYAGSSLGAIWNLIHPLMLIAVYMTIFSSLMPSRGPAQAGLNDYGPLNYGVHLCAGLLPWLLFSDVLTRSTGLLLENSNFLQKVSFPPLAMFWSVLFNALLINGAGYLIFCLALVLLGHSVPMLALAGLGVMALFGLTAMGLGLILAGIQVFIRDTAQVITVGMQFLFWFNPIIYDKSMLFKPAEGQQLESLKVFGQTLLAWNPIERFITATQTLFGATTMPSTGWDWVIIFVAPMIALGLGIFFFRRLLPEVRDCL